MHRFHSNQPGLYRIGEKRSEFRLGQLLKRMCQNRKHADAPEFFDHIDQLQP